MDTTAKTEAKSNPNNPAHDLDPAGGKAKENRDQIKIVTTAPTGATNVVVVVTGVKEVEDKMPKYVAIRFGAYPFHAETTVTPHEARTLAAHLIEVANYAEGK